MIIINDTKENFSVQLSDNIIELTEMRRSYSNRVEICIKCMENINELRTRTDNIKLETLYDKAQLSLSTFLKQISLIGSTLTSLEKMQENESINEQEITEYNQTYQQLKKDYLNNSIYNENIMIDFVRFQNQLMEGETKEIQSEIPISENIETNDTLLISELKGKVILPYTRAEVIELLRSNPSKYESAQDVISKEFTKDFVEYQHQALARFREAYELVTKREHYSKLDGINLGLEMFGKRLLHPAIITACRSLDELDVYIDCLEKNEVDDFRIFEIEYELTPAIVQNNASMWKEFFHSFFKKKEKNS